MADLSQTWWDTCGEIGRFFTNPCWSASSWPRRKWPWSSSTGRSSSCATSNCSSNCSIELMSNNTNSWQVINSTSHAPSCPLTELWEWGRRCRAIGCQWRWSATSWPISCPTCSHTSGFTSRLLTTGNLSSSSFCKCISRVGRFCSCQLNGATLIQQKTDDNPDIKDFLKVPNAR